MDPTILRMISTGSLSAFSASATNGALGRVAAAVPVQRVRAQASPAPTGVAAAPGGRSAPPQVQPGQILPRGSLLDLSV
jgi:hypothetical protein